MTRVTRSIALLAQALCGALLLVGALVSVSSIAAADKFEGMACFWSGTAPGCGGEEADCPSNYHYEGGSKTGVGFGRMSKYFGDLCYYGYKVLCCRREFAKSPPNPPPLPPKTNTTNMCMFNCSLGGDGSKASFSKCKAKCGLTPTGQGGGVGR